MAAPPTRPPSRASTNAASSTIPPRAALISSTPGRAFSNALRPSSPFVSLVRGTCTVIASARASSSSNETSSTSSFSAAACEMNGS
jgi:hypothetical protein